MRVCVIIMGHIHASLCMDATHVWVRVNVMCHAHEFVYGIWYTLYSICTLYRISTLCGTYTLYTIYTVTWECTEGVNTLSIVYSLYALYTRNTLARDTWKHPQKRAVTLWHETWECTECIQCIEGVNTLSIVYSLYALYKLNTLSRDTWKHPQKRVVSECIYTLETPSKEAG